MPRSLKTNSAPLKGKKAAEMRRQAALLLSEAIDSLLRIRRLQMLRKLGANPELRRKEVKRDYIIVGGTKIPFSEIKKTMVQVMVDLAAVPQRGGFVVFERDSARKLKKAFELFPGLAREIRAEYPEQFAAVARVFVEMRRAKKTRAKKVL